MSKSSMVVVWLVSYSKHTASSLSSGCWSAKSFTSKGLVKRTKKLFLTPILSLAGSAKRLKQEDGKILDYNLSIYHVAFKNHQCRNSYLSKSVSRRIKSPPRIAIITKPYLLETTMSSLSNCSFPRMQKAKQSHSATPRKTSLVYTWANKRLSTVPVFTNASNTSKRRTGSGFIFLAGVL